MSLPEQEVKRLLTTIQIKVIINYKLQRKGHLMFTSFRFWLSFRLIKLGIVTCPDEECQHWIRYGMSIAGEGIEKGILEDEGF